MGSCSQPFISSSLLLQPKKGGGISFNSTVTLTQCSEKLVQLILHEYSILPEGAMWEGPPEPEALWPRVTVDSPRTPDASSRL